MKSNVNLYLNADGTKVVTEGDPEAASLLVNAGRDIPDAEVERMGEGLLAQAQKLGEKAVAKTEDKSVEAPSENKANKKD